MKDKLTNGFVQGFIAGVVSSIADLIMVNWLKFGDTRFLDYAGVHIYGFKPETLGEQIFAQFVQFLFTGLLGIIFVYLIDKVKQRNILFKGQLYGVAIWFVVYTITILFKLKPLDKISLASTLENFIASMIFGAVLAIAYAVLSKKIVD
jgi:hypothetical protein